MTSMIPPGIVMTFATDVACIRITQFNRKRQRSSNEYKHVDSNNPLNTTPDETSDEWDTEELRESATGTKDIL